MGGQVTLRQDAGGHWRLTATGPRVTLDEGLWSVLRFGMEAAGRPLRSAEAQFAALHAAVTPRDMTLNYVAQGDGLTMSTA
jgi:hypothetical protein